MEMHLREAIVLSAIVASAACTPAGAGPAPRARPTANAGSTTSASVGGAAAVIPPGEAKVGDRTVCLISDEEFVVTAASPKVEHEGKTYYFCCPGCDSDFRKSPEKYLRKIH